MVTSHISFRPSPANTPAVQGDRMNAMRLSMGGFFGKQTQLLPLQGDGVQIKTAFMHLRCPAVTLVPMLFTVVLAFPSAVHSQPVPDPLRPPSAIAHQDLSPTGVEQTDHPAALVLQATRIDRRQKQAIINGTPYQLGDHIGKARITAISAAEVRLQQDDGEIILRFPQTGLNKRSADISR